MRRSNGRSARLMVLPLVLASGCAQLPELLPPPPSGTAPPMGSIATQVHQRANQHRLAVNLPALAEDPTLSSLARQHSERMAAGAVPFGHAGFDDRFAAARASLAITRMAENVATSYNYPESAVGRLAVEQWIGSAGHRANLEGPFQLAGAGWARNSRGEYFVTQIYATR